MRIDLPLCNFKYCRYSQDCNCIGGGSKRQYCDYLRLSNNRRNLNEFVSKKIRGYVFCKSRV